MNEGDIRVRHGGMFLGEFEGWKIVELLGWEVEGRRSERA